MVIISNGFNKFYLSVAAAEANKRGLLSSFITGAYPTPAVRKILALPGVNSSRKLQRLSARGEAIPDTLIGHLWRAEARCVLADLAHKFGNGTPAVASVAAYRQYGHQAVRYVREAAARGARIYHYRAGFGHASVRVAKELGLFTLCDHSIAHPAVLQFLVNHGGRLPLAGEPVEVDSFWADVLDDINQADAVLVNSYFVQRTFLHQGYEAGRIHVAFLGVDDAFLTAIPSGERQSYPEGPLRMLFAGTFEPRKGANVLIRALAEPLAGLPWELQIAGRIDDRLRSEASGFFDDARVTSLGVLSRDELASAMSQAEVFAFPSLAEGSARVIFEALACGCYVITTPNSGSIVENGVHGALVPPGDAVALAGAIRQAFADRSTLRDIGLCNAALVRSHYRQSDYGNKLASLYAALIN